MIGSWDRVTGCGRTSTWSTSALVFRISRHGRNRGVYVLPSWRREAHSLVSLWDSMDGIGAVTGPEQASTTPRTHGTWPDSNPGRAPPGFVGLGPIAIEGSGIASSPKSCAGCAREIPARPRARAAGRRECRRDNRSPLAGAHTIWGSSCRRPGAMSSAAGRKAIGGREGVTLPCRAGGRRQATNADLRAVHARLQRRRPDDAGWTKVAALSRRASRWAVPFDRRLPRRRI
jgi:hypothetical protein